MIGEPDVHVNLGEHWGEVSEVMYVAFRASERVLWARD
jgi:hypothetical protein